MWGVQRPMGREVNCRPTRPCHWVSVTSILLPFNLYYMYYNYIGELSSRFDEFLAARLQFNSDHGVDFSAPTFRQSATFVRPLFAFYCTLFLR